MQADETMPVHPRDLVTQGAHFGAQVGRGPFRFTVAAHPTPPVKGLKTHRLH